MQHPTRDETDERQMTFLEHLAELRMRLILSVLFLVLGTTAGILLSTPAFNLLMRPFQGVENRRTDAAVKLRVLPGGELRLGGLEEAEDVSPAYFEGISARRIEFYLPDQPLEGAPVWSFDAAPRKPIFLHPLDPIMILMKTSLILGLIISLPLILHQVWLFVAPGLHKGEKRAALPLLALAALLFPAGAAFAYVGFGQVLDFLLNFQILDIEPMLEVNKMISLEIRMMLIFGFVFEMPVAIIFLTAIGVLHPSFLRTHRSHAIVFMGVASMLLTPADPLSMLIMLVPLIILYELSIWLSIPVARRRAEELELESEDADGGTGA